MTMTVKRIIFSVFIFLNIINFLNAKGCSDGTFCPGDYTCCTDQSINKCCRISSGVCCAQNLGCCDKNYICDTNAKKCKYNVGDAINSLRFLDYSLEMEPLIDQ
jgi:hypothetical protein